jgi:hypothetical protein
MKTLQKILCGSSELFKDIEYFVPGDTDYILITNSEVVFEHKHPTENVCWFIWGKDKELVRKYIMQFPYYMSSMSLVTKSFVDYYEFSLSDVITAIDNYYSIYETSNYRYYIPLFDYIKTQGSWNFPDEVLYKSYQLYKEFKKR